ncbi:MAG: 50S ribosomal protein L32e [Candidatus Njordarchaeales archaeon]
MVLPLSNITKTELERLMRIKKKRKRKFIRPYSWIWKKLDENWRRPRGKDNKVRLQIKGKPPLVKVGYRSPRKVRYLHPSGKEEVLVYKVEDLYNVDPLNQVVRIARTVGIRKRIEILKFARRFGIRVLNPGRAEARLELEISGEERAEGVEEVEEGTEEEVEEEMGEEEVEEE